MPKPRKTSRRSSWSPNKPTRRKREPVTTYFVEPTSTPRRGTRASGTNLRAQCKNPRALGVSPRQIKALAPELTDAEARDIAHHLQRRLARAGDQVVPADEVEKAIAQRPLSPAQAANRNQSGLCKCGCGKRTPLAKQSHRLKGWMKGEPLAYVHGHNPRGKEKAPPISSLPLPETQERPRTKLTAEKAAVAETLYVSWFAHLKRCCKDEFGDLADDHVHDVFVRICEALNDRPDSSNLAAWVNRIADNLAIDKHRRDNAFKHALERLKLEAIVKSPASQRAFFLAQPRRFAANLQP